MAQGSIQRKGKTWYAVIPFGKKRIWKKGGPTKKDAEKVLRDNLLDLDNNGYQPIVKITFSRFIEEWLTAYAPLHYKDSTLDQYKNLCGLFKRHFPEDKRVDTFTSRDINTFIATMTGSKLDTGTIAVRLQTLNVIFKYAISQNYIKKNPLDGIQKPRKESYDESTEGEVEILTLPQISKFIKEVGGFYRTGLLILLYTGMRTGELIGLKWDDIDFASNKIHIRRRVYKGKYNTPKSKASRRKIDMIPDLVALLKEHKLKCPVTVDNLVYPSEEKKLCHHQAIYVSFKRQLEKLGLPSVKLHSLRHTNASLRIRMNQSPKYIQSQMGHSNIKITFDLYGHLFPQDEAFRAQQTNSLQESFNSLTKITPAKVVPLKTVRNRLEKPVLKAQKSA